MSWDDLTTTLSLKKHFRNAIINFKQNSVNPTVALFDMVPVKGPFKTLSLTVTVKPKSETNQYKHHSICRRDYSNLRKKKVIS